MAGYRGTSGYDPNAYPHYGKPLRPYNWVQWSGVALVVVGIAIDLAYFAGEFGWVARMRGTPTIALAPLFIGISLVNSRREQMPDPAPELAAQRRRWLIVTVAVCAILLGAATILAMKGY